MQGGSRQHLGGLDGLRALAVIGVLLYHAGVLRGGFIGVEVFFVLSGYLITSLLLEEWRASQQGINVAEFWRRRARRLLPASTAMIVITLALAAVLVPDELATTRTSAAAGLLSISNWYAVFAQQSYFEAIGRPPLLRHLWSLAIEAQFYLVWPLLLTLGLRVLSPRKLGVVALGGALTSALVMWLLFEPGVDPSRVYYGTDTRASGLLIGAALALSSLRVRAPRLVLEGMGLLALGALAVIAYQLSEFDPRLYRGGFVVVGLLTAVAVAASVRGGRVLSWAPLQWIGVRSYGMYLWHWPVFMLSRPNLDVPLDGVPLRILQLTAVGLLAAGSYRWIERPFRTGDLRMKHGLRWAAISGSAVTALILVGTSAVSARPIERPSYLPVDAIDTWQDSQLVVAATGTGSAVLESATVADQAVPAIDTSDTVQPTADPTDMASSSPQPVAAPPPARAPRRVTAIGDSVMLGAANALSQAIDGIEVDAAISRQAATFIQILRQRAASRSLGDVMVVHVGNNGPLSDDQFDTMMDVLAPVDRVVIVTVKVPRAWEGPNNAILRDGAQRYPTAVLADWQAASSGEPFLFWDDGTHLRPEGAAEYAALIASRAEP